MIKKITLTLLLLLFLGGAGIALYNILSINLEYRASEKTYAQMQDYIQLPSAVAEETGIPEPAAAAAETNAKTETATEPTDPTEPAREPVVYPEVDFASLRMVNEDVVGWVYIEDTKINYPILQGRDNRHYVSTLIDGQYNGAGSIFMDYRNTPDFSDRHTVLYGHNMRNGTMFAGITEYRDQEYYDDHPMGLIMTPDGNFRFEIVASYVASLADPAWQLEFVDDADAAGWLETAMERSPFTSRYQPKAGDRMITLSTCTYEFDDARFVLVGILTGEE